MNEKKMTYNPYSPAVLQALKDLRAKTSAVIDLYDMTYKIPYSPIVHSLTDYLDKHFGNPPRDTCTDDEVRALAKLAVRNGRMTHNCMADTLGVTYQVLWRWIHYGQPIHPVKKRDLYKIVGTL